ncbi:hypothetical protein Ae201684P_019461 [Aphanomyces euteiches]|uniref:Secreted protein n=1 Tax=Aphanomyces euteiches TaxID=100861 RepID=A0A6G0WJ58_9STRA|nr:hypothetical protein Ae201684_014682 [Aphanomyces euteiches]KAH9078371.1 hypothetical protein Ae201684P_019461 [Aphanomyces euteiches]
MLRICLARWLAKSAMVCFGYSSCEDSRARSSVGLITYKKSPWRMASDRTKGTARRSPSGGAGPTSWRSTTM